MENNNLRVSHLLKYLKNSVSSIYIAHTLHRQRYVQIDRHGVSLSFSRINSPCCQRHGGEKKPGDKKAAPMSLVSPAPATHKECCKLPPLSFSREINTRCISLARSDARRESSARRAFSSRHRDVLSSGFRGLGKSPPGRICRLGEERKRGEYIAFGTRFHSSDPWQTYNGRDECTCQSSERRRSEHHEVAVARSRPRVIDFE